MGKPWELKALKLLRQGFAKVVFGITTLRLADSSESFATGEKGGLSLLMSLLGLRQIVSLRDII